MKSTLIVLLGAALAVALGLYAYMWLGMYNMGADSPHWNMTVSMLTMMRERSIEKHAASLTVPGNINDSKLILKGAGQYAAMCAGCHLAPGVTDSEIRPGLYPQPPNLSQVRVDARKAFWVIKHGIKMSAMSAWGFSHDDATIWSMVAFLQKMPGMTPAEYQANVAKAPPDDDMGPMDPGAMMGGGHAHGHGSAGAPTTATASAPAAHDHGGHDHGGTPSAHAGNMQGMSGMDMGGAGRAGGVPAAEAVAAAFQSALQRDGRAAALTLLAPAAQIREGGETQDHSAYAGHHLAADIAFLKTVRVELRERRSHMQGAQAVVTSIYDVRGRAHDKPIAVRNTETLTLARAGTGWTIVAVDWSSAPLPGEDA
ncbi:MAG: c-type cytochrome [Metallibacterium sp.]